MKIVKYRTKYFLYVFSRDVNILPGIGCGTIKNSTNEKLDKAHDLGSVGRNDHDSSRLPIGFCCIVPQSETRILSLRMKG